MRYLVRMGFDNKTFAAAILDMAARGYLKIKEDAGSYMLSLTDKDERVLTPDEKQIAGVLFEGRKVIWLVQDNHEVHPSSFAGRPEVAEDRGIHSSVDVPFYFSRGLGRSVRFFYLSKGLASMSAATMSLSSNITERRPGPLKLPRTQQSFRWPYYATTRGISKRFPRPLTIFIASAD